MALTAATAAAAAADRPVVELLAVYAGAFVTVAAAVGLVWRMVRPSVEAYVRGLVQPLRESVQAVREEALTARDAAAPAAQLVHTQLDDVVDRLDRVEARGLILSATLDDHVTYLRDVRDALVAQGVRLPARRKGTRPTGLPPNQRNQRKGDQ